MVRSRIKTDIALLVLFLLAFTTSILQEIFSITAPYKSFAWMLLIVFWIFSLRNEFYDRKVLFLLGTAGFMLFLLFVLRLLRWDVTQPGTTADHFLWYAYYIPICVIPYLSFCLSLYAGKKSGEKERRLAVMFGVLCAILAVLTLTTGLHGLTIKIHQEAGKEWAVHGPVYYAIVVFCFLLMLLSYVVVLKKSRVLMVRRKWYIPVLTCALGLVMFVAYYLNGGQSPQIRGIRLYYFQEVMIVLFLGFWEGCILTGLLPTVSLAKEGNWLRTGIMKATEEQVSAIRDRLNLAFYEDEARFREDIRFVATRGVYIKRRANLELISDAKKDLSTKELSLCIRESLEYYSLSGVSVGLEETGEGNVPSLLITTAYELFEKIMEPERSACYIRLQTNVEEDEVSFRMLLEVDTAESGEDAAKAYIQSLMDSEFLYYLGGSVSMTEKDETLFVSLQADYPMQKTGSIPHGLSGLAEYLSIEEEALALKIQIHDSIGRALLMTKRYLLSPSDVGKDVLVMEWNRCFSFMENPNVPRNHSEQNGMRQESFALCRDRAKKLGIEVEVDGNFPNDPSIRFLIDSAITVQITNVFRHTNGHRVFVSIKEEDGNVSLTLTNDGDFKPAAVQERGGLRNLRRWIEESGGSMEIASTERFRLFISVPLKETLEGQ